MGCVVGVFVFYGCPLVCDCCAVFSYVFLFLSCGGAVFGGCVGEGALYLWGGELCELGGVVDDEFLDGGSCTFLRLRQGRRFVFVAGLAGIWRRRC